MQLPESAGLEGHVRRSDGLGDEEVGRIDTVEGASVPRHWLGVVLEGAVHIRGIASEWAVAAGDVGPGTHVGLGDVGIDCRDRIEYADVDTEVLG